MVTQIPPSTVDSLQELKDRIEAFLLGLRRPVLIEAGREILDLSSSCYSLTYEYGKLLWHVWNEKTNFVRHLTGIGKESVSRMEIRYQRFGKGPPGTLVLMESRAAPEQLQRRGERSRFAQQLRKRLAQLCPEWRIESLTSEPDLNRSFSGSYARGVLSRGQQVWAVIGAGPQEGTATAEGILTYGLVWLDWLRARETKRVVQGLKILVPESASATTVQRLACMNSSLASWEVYELGADVVRVDPADIGNLKISLPHAGQKMESLSSAWIKRIRGLSREIQVRLTSDGACTLNIAGLPFAREGVNGVFFGIGRAETLLTDSNFPELQRLISKIVRIRRPSSQDPLHPYYRLQPEKWMQSLLVRELRVLDPNLAPEIVYEQVPAFSGLERGLMDLLAVNSQGRLVIVECKAAEDIHLPLQALDYWMRVRWHQQRGDLEANGYFPNKKLNAEKPLLLLVSPALQFHPACETVLKYFSPEIEVVRIGLNESWREKVQVVFRLGRN